MPAVSEDCNSTSGREASESPEREIFGVPDTSDVPVAAMSEGCESAGPREAAESPEMESFVVPGTSSDPLIPAVGEDCSSTGPRKASKAEGETFEAVVEAEARGVQALEATVPAAESPAHDPSIGLALVPDSSSMPNLQALPPRLQQRAIPEPPGAISVKQLRRKAVALKKPPKAVKGSAATSKAPAGQVAVVAVNSPRDPKCIEGRALRVLSDAAMEGLEPSQSSPSAPLLQERKHYGGVFKNGRFERTRATTLDQLTEAQKQEILRDIEEQRRQKVEELMRRQKRHVARQRREQQMEAQTVLGREHSHLWSQGMGKAMGKKTWGYQSSPSLYQDGQMLQYLNHQVLPDQGKRGAGRVKKFHAATTAAMSPQRVLHRHVHHHMHFHEPDSPNDSPNHELTMLPDRSSSLRNARSLRPASMSCFRAASEGNLHTPPTRYVFAGEESVQSGRPDWSPALEEEETPRRTSFQQVFVDK